MEKTSGMKWVNKTMIMLFFDVFQRNSTQWVLNTNYKKLYVLTIFSWFNASFYTLLFKHACVFEKLKLKETYRIYFAEVLKYDISEAATQRCS